VSETSRTYLPLGIDMAGVRCLVVGGGRIGTRKALTLAAAGARVTVLAPWISDRLTAVVEHGEVEWQAGQYDPSQLHGVAMVVAATDDRSLNIAIGSDADERSILSCVVSPGRFSRVIFPAVHVAEELTVAVHSGGRDCAASRTLRNDVAHWLKSRNARPHCLTVFGVQRSDLPNQVFDALQKHGREIVQRALGDAPRVLLSTCRRWECYALQAASNDLCRAIQDELGIVPETLDAAFRRRSGPAAQYHLLRVATGLESPLRGETDVVGQIRVAMQESLGEGATDLRRAFESALLAQKRIRADARLPAANRGWAAACVATLRRDLGTLAGRRILVVGCGRLGEGVARRLHAEGVEIIALSRRSDVPWCAELGVELRRMDSLADALSAANSTVLLRTVDRPQESARLSALASSSVLLDMAGGNDWLNGPGVSFRDIYDVAAASHDGPDEACFATAGRMVYEKTLRGHVAEGGSAHIRVGARSSTLSRVQVEEVRDLLRLVTPQSTIKAVFYGSPGDRDKATPLPEVHNDDFFTRDLDAALLSGEIDVAVHSAKDLPDRIPEGLFVAAVTPALAPWDCLVSRNGERLADLVPGAVVGTSSERRRECILRLRPDLRTLDIRGDVPERVAQLDAGAYDTLVLAAVGLMRLGMPERISHVFSEREFPPAPGQGSLALLARVEDEKLRTLLAPLDLGERNVMPWA